MELNINSVWILALLQSEIKHTTINKIQSKVLRKYEIQQYERGCDGDWIILQDTFNSILKKATKY